MSLLPGLQRSLHRRERWAGDYYVEPAWAVEALFDALIFAGPIHDPAQGSGTIPRVARDYGFEASGSDLVARNGHPGGVDFLADDTPRSTLIFNAPYKLNEPFIKHALAVAANGVAAIVRVPFLCGQRRYTELFTPHPPAIVLMLPQRPSMPPGESGIPAKGGTADYCWIIWRIGFQGRSVIQWAAPLPCAGG
jgi:hypothetical protein